MKTLKITKLTISFLFGILISLNSNAADIQTRHMSTEAVHDKEAIWENKVIPVCWEDGITEANLQKLVKVAVTDTWQKHSQLKFTGWGTCGQHDRGIRISVNDQYWPKVLDFGDNLDGKKNGMHLNFNLGIKPEFASCAGENREYCIKVIAVHEFGHAIGLHHEQNRSDTDRASKCYKEEYQGDVPNEWLVTAHDLHSVMNYCNPKYNGDGKLSQLDIEGLHIVYGVPLVGCAIEAGPLWSNTEAQSKCGSVCQKVGGQFNGGWWTTQESVMSVCVCEMQACPS